MFVYWILYPLLLVFTLTGLGLGVRRLSVPFGAAMLLPVGYSVGIVVAAVPTYWGATTDATGPLLILLAIAGWGFSFKDLRAAVQAGAFKRNWEWMVAAALAFFAFGASVIMSGRATFTGYNQIVDIAMQMNFTGYLAEHGRDPIVAPASSFLRAVAGTLSTGYPGGPQALLGAFPNTFGMEISSAWQPYLALAATLIVLPSYSLLRLVTKNRAFAAVGAFAAGQASTLISYGLIGGIKEMTAAATIIAAAALIPTASTPDKPFWRAGLPFAIGLAGAYSVFSLTLLPWLGILGLGTAVVVWREVSLRAALQRAGFALVVFAIITLPTSIPARQSSGFAHLMEKEVGNLADPVNKWAVTGVWFTPDHRFALHGTALTLSIIVGIFVILLAILGIYAAWKAKAHALYILLGASLAGWLVLIVKLGPWVEFKGLAVTSPVMLMMAAAGLTTFANASRRELLWGAWTGLAVLVISGVYSDISRYGSAQLAPSDRLAEYRAFANRYAGTTSITPDWDEHAGFQARKANLLQEFNEPFQLVPGEDPKLLVTKPQWDLDQLLPSFLSTFDEIITRRSPGLSRPPGNFSLASQGQFFSIWKRGPGKTAAQHLALSGVSAPQEKTKCEAFIRALPKTQTVTIAPATPYYAVAKFDQSKQPKGFVVTGDAVLFKGKSGTANGGVDLGAFSGPFEIYLTSYNHRKTTVTIDGKTFTAPNDQSAAIRPTYLGTVDLAGGQHDVLVNTAGTSLAPGSSLHFNEGSWAGPVQLVPKGTLYPPLIKAKAGVAKCPVAVDWVEAG